MKGLKFKYFCLWLKKLVEIIEIDRLGLFFMFLNLRCYDKIGRCEKYVTYLNV